MLNESGNLIEENILISKELLDFALANNYKISLKSGDFQKSPILTTRGQRYNKDLVTQVNRLYLSGHYYPREYFEVFGLSSPDSIIQIFKQLGLKTLSRKESQELYGNKIQQQIANTNIVRYGETAPTKNPEIRQKAKDTCIQKFGVDNAFKLPELKEKAKETMVSKYGVKHSLQSPELKAKAKATWNQKHGDGEWVTSIPKVRDKITQTCIAKFGSKTPFESPYVHETIIKNNLEKYGVHTTLLLPEVKFKAQITRKWNQFNSPKTELQNA